MPKLTLTLSDAQLVTRVAVRLSDVSCSVFPLSRQIRADIVRRVVGPVLQPVFQCIILGLFLALQASATDWANVGLLYDTFDLTLAPGHRMEAAGPLFYREEKEATRLWAVP